MADPLLDPLLTGAVVAGGPPPSAVVVRSLVVVRRGAGAACRGAACTARWTVAPGIGPAAAGAVVGAGTAAAVVGAAPGVRVLGALRRGVAPADVRRPPVCGSPGRVPPVRTFAGCAPPVPGAPGTDAPDPAVPRPGWGCCTSRRQVAATTGRAGLPPAVVVGAAENPSAAPVFTFRSRPESRVRERWTVGVSAAVPTEGVARACPPSRLGPMFRIRTGAGGVAGEAEAPGAGVAVPDPVLVTVPDSVRGWTRSPSTARCTGAAAERTGIADGVLGEVVEAGAGVACGGVDCGAGAPEGLGCVRRRSPRSGASRWTRAVDGREARGVPIPPRVRPRGPGASAGCAEVGALGRCGVREVLVGACPGGGVAAGEDGAAAAGASDV
ncbi:hypothetical protein STIB_54560 [Streptomyces sp. IB2014 011-1]|nr:hypothetical protein STIB_54560 [Streptomyces sp. IB2014 011-1]